MMPGWSSGLEHYFFAHISILDWEVCSSNLNWVNLNFNLTKPCYSTSQGGGYIFENVYEKSLNKMKTEKKFGGRWLGTNIFKKMLENQL
jgi:hypothetical protein